MLKIQKVMSRINTNIFIERAQKIHGTKYDYSKVIYIKSSEKVCIICPEHGEFWQTPNSHITSKQGCPKCGKTGKLTQEEFIKKARHIHNDKYDYSKVQYVNSQTKVCIICPEHGEFWQTPSSHLDRQGCRKCYGNYKSNTEEFIEKAKKIHGDKYDYSKVQYVNNKTKVCIICPIHGEFWQKPNVHLRGNGCINCKYETDVKKRTKTKEQFIQDAIKTHGNRYDYSKVEYINNHTKICIICNETNKYGHIHGEFWQKPNNHIHGQQCPKCAKKMSRLERRVQDFLIENDFLFIKEKKFEWLGDLRLDFFLPDYNIAIECQGEQHFKPVDFAGKGEEWAKENLIETKQRDSLKYNLCNEHNIQILYYTTKKINKLSDCENITNLKIIKEIILKKEKNEEVINLH